MSVRQRNPCSIGPAYWSALADFNVPNVRLTWPGSPRQGLGFEFPFRKTARSAGWYSAVFGGEDDTVFEIALGVTPVTMAQPLYRAAPVSPPAR